MLAGVISSVKRGTKLLLTDSSRTNKKNDNEYNILDDFSNGAFKRRITTLSLSNLYKYRKTIGLPLLVSLISIIFIIYLLLRWIGGITPQAANIASKSLNEESDYRIVGWNSNNDDRKSADFDCEELTEGEYVDRATKWNDNKRKRKLRGLLTSMRQIANDIKTTCLCSRMLGVEKKMLLLSDENGETTYLANCILYDHIHSRGMSLVTESLKPLFPDREDAVKVPRYNGILLQCVEINEYPPHSIKSCRSVYPSFRDEVAWQIQSCIDMDNGITIYQKAVSS